MHMRDNSNELLVLGMRRRISAILGLVGGLVDLWAGLSILFQTPMGMGLAENTRLLGYFLIVLGIIVLMTGVLMFSPREMSGLTGWLMMISGLVMLFLGVGMISGILNEMTQWSVFSGIVMMALGLLMLYGGSDMSRKRM
jgi:hypothetical protein